MMSKICVCIFAATILIDKFCVPFFRFECDKEDQIKDTIKSIQGKTKNLKTLAVSVPELSLLNSEMAKATSNRSDNAAISMISKKTGIFGENKIGSDAAVSTIVESKPTPIFPPETLTTSMSTTEENLVICVKYSSLNADETVPHPDVQQFDGAVIVTVIDILFSFTFLIQFN